MTDLLIKKYKSNDYQGPPPYLDMFKIRSAPDRGSVHCPGFLIRKKTSHLDFPRIFFIEGILL